MRRTVVAHCIKEEQGLITKHPKQKFKIKFWNRPRATEKNHEQRTTEQLKDGRRRPNYV